MIRRRLTKSLIYSAEKHLRTMAAGPINTRKHLAAALEALYLYIQRNQPVMAGMSCAHQTETGATRSHGRPARRPRSWISKRGPQKRHRRISSRPRNSTLMIFNKKQNAETFSLSRR